MDEMKNRYEIVKLKDGTYVLLDKENCYWCFGFAVGQSVWVELKDESLIKGVITRVLITHEEEYSYKVELAFGGHEDVIVTIAECEIVDMGEWIIPKTGNIN